VAIVFLPLAIWFGWRVWQEFVLEAPATEGDDPFD
jgi:predicted negative regulator of RcsB-dependent stress response